MSEKPYLVDPEREALVTGIYVRALRGECWDSVDIVDIAELDAESLLRWLRSRGGENKWAESCVFALLRHETPREAVDPDDE